MYLSVAGGWGPTHLGALWIPLLSFELRDWNMFTWLYGLNQWLWKLRRSGWKCWKYGSGTFDLEEYGIGGRGGRGEKNGNGKSYGSGGRGGINGTEEYGSGGRGGINGMSFCFKSSSFCEPSSSSEEFRAAFAEIKRWLASTWAKACSYFAWN